MSVRRHSSCRIGVTVVAVLLLSGVAFGARPASAGRPGPAIPKLEWQPCGDEFPGTDCAIAKVPMDYRQPHKATTSIALARIPAADQANRIGTVFINPGGPGGSGVELVLGGFGQFLEDNLDGRFDVIGFDPRGVGASDPLHCFESEDALNDYFGAQPAFPYQRDQYRPFFDVYSGLGDRCLDGSDPVARHMSTADVARDLDLLRQAVGDAKLNYLGFSYGSYLGNTYANMFPKNVRALVIDGVLDPRLWSSGFQIVSDRVATEQEFGEFLRLCDEAGPDCAFAAPEGSRARWEALADAIRAHPLDLGDGIIYTYDFLIGDGASAMYAPETWGGEDGFGALFDFLADAALGDQAAAANAGLVRASLIDRLKPAPANEPDYDNGLDAYYGNQCADTQYPHSLAGFLLTDRFAAAGSRFGPYWWWFNAGCADWPVAPRPLRRPVDGSHVGARPRRRQLLRRRDGLCRRPGQCETAEEQSPAQLRRVGPHGLRAQRLRDRPRRRLSDRRHAATGGHGLPGQPESVRAVSAAHGDGDGTVDRAASRAAVAPVAASLQSIGLDIVRRCVSVVDIC